MEGRQVGLRRQIAMPQPDRRRYADDRRHLRQHQEEEEEIRHTIQRKKKTYKKNQVHEEEESNPDIPKPVTKSSQSVPVEGYGPLNINISYNSQNSVNELDSNKIDDDDDCKKIKRKPSKNLGKYEEDGERIHNNSDWIYGTHAWTNKPDYYIPNKNEIANANKYKKNDLVCPLMVNTPWTEYKSGDSEPEPYNL